MKNGKLKFEEKEMNDMVSQLKMDLQQENNKYNKLQTQYNEMLSRNNSMIAELHNKIRESDVQIYKYIIYYIL